MISGLFVSQTKSDNIAGSQLYKSLINSGALVFKLNKLVWKGLLLQYATQDFSENRVGRRTCKVNDRAQETS